MIQNYTEDRGEQKPYSVIIPVDHKNADFVKTVIRFIHRNLLEAEHIYLIANIDLKSAIMKGENAPHDFSFIDEDSLIPGLSFEDIRRCLVARPNMTANFTGWYFQQILKFAFALTDYCGEYYLSWDSDTLPISNLKFFQDGKPLFTAKKEYHKPYFNTMERLIGIGKTAPFSFIAEHTMFRREFVLELIDEINKSVVPGTTWFEKIINACEFEIGNTNLFSEFETYGTFCTVKHPNFYGVQYLNTLRSAAMIRGRHITDTLIDRLSADIDIASFEIYDEMFPFDFDKRKLNWQKRIRKYRRLLSSDGVRKIIRRVKRVFLN